ncbi:4Fe-4S binding protein [Planobispora longispora]|uniref:4Fe-4S binding protein n=1 Tax=Planobispora longispora TaxID=28887 RepID=UPI00361291AF
MLRRSVTQQYPEVRPDLPARSRGVIALVEENCTVCMLCARECPDWCIYIDSHKETLPAPEGGRPRARNVLDRFAIDFSLCMYCGICIEVCPFDALFWSPEFEYAEGDIRNLVHEKDRLAAWAQTVPPPPRPRAQRRSSQGTRGGLPPRPPHSRPRRLPSRPPRSRPEPRQGGAPLPSGAPARKNSLPPGVPMTRAPLPAGTPARRQGEPEPEARMSSPAPPPTSRPRARPARTVRIGRYGGHRPGTPTSGR